MPALFRHPGFWPGAVDLQIQSRSTSRYRVRFLCELSEIRAVRAGVSRKFAEWAFGEDVAYDALTIVSELTTNAVRHAGAARGSGVGPTSRSSFFLDLWVAANVLYVAVHDDNDRTPVVRPSSDDAETGRGLQLVTSLTGGVWGFYHLANGPGKVVWAGLRLDAGMSTTGHVAAQVDAGYPKAAGTGCRERVRVARWPRLHRKRRTALGNLRRLTWRELLDRSAATHDAHPP